MNTKQQYITKLIIGSLFSFILILWMALSSKAAQHKSKKPYRVEQFSISTPGQLNVTTSGGYIEVTGSKTDHVKVEMYVSKNGHTLTPADTDLDDFDISIKKEGNTVQAMAKHEGSWKFWKEKNISISFVVYTPRKMATDLRTSGGHIEATGLTGDQHMKTSGGHLSLKDLHGNIEARTSGGHIEIANVSGHVQARTSGGHIAARNTRGILQVHTSGGHIELHDISGSVKATTSGGHISAGFQKMGKYAELRTSGGGIDITVPKNQGLNINLHGSEVRTQLKNFSGSMKDDNVEGTVNGGGTKLEAQTSGGTVRLSFN